jgi:hypothetical protein
MKTVKIMFGPRDAVEFAASSVTVVPSASGVRLDIVSDDMEGRKVTLYPGTLFPFLIEGS